MDQAHLERLRNAEVDTVRDWFKPGARVLEIGAGNGFQARILSSWGCVVEAVDLVDRPRHSPMHFAVRPYDGRHLPFKDSDFDIVFSSNVLEHIRSISEFLSEIRRVLKPDGIAIHILPSPAWRFWTSLSHYLFLIKRLLGGMKESSVRDMKDVQDAKRRRGLGFVMKRVLSAGPHGEYPNAPAELYFFSRYRWLRLFKDSGFRPAMIRTNGLFYTGYGIFPSIALTTRRHLARVLGSACNIFVLTKVSSVTPPI